MDSQDHARTESRRIARAAGVLSSATALSRVLGYLRDALTAAYFGAGGSMDAFLVAFRLPNLLRSLFAEGALTVAFVPVFVQELETGGRERADRLGRSAFTLLGSVLLAVAAAGVLGAPLLVRLIAWGFSADPEKLALTVDLTRIVFPYAALVGLTALAGGMLNAFGDFASPGLAPVALNVGIIAGTVGLYSLCTPPIRSVAYGVLLGGGCQLLLQAWGLRRQGFRFRLRWGWDQALRSVLARMGPRVFGVAVYQVNVIVSTFLATWLPSGSVSYLYYAERVFQLPLGIFAISVGTASLPSLSRLAARGDDRAFRETLSGALRMTAFIVLPASAGLMALAEPIVAVLLGRGSFGPETVHATADALFFYAMALIPLAGTKVLAPAYYALDDVRTPVRAGLWSVLLNFAASALLLGPMKHAGLAAATALSSAFNFLYLYVVLRKGLGRGTDGLADPLARMAACAAAMALLVWGVAATLFWNTPAGLLRAVGLFGIVALGVCFYGAAAHLLGLPEPSRIAGALRSRAQPES